MLEIMDQLLDPTALIQSAGLVGIFIAVFAESGLFIGFMLPGDSLLFTAGFLASQQLLPIVPLVLGTFICAVLGDSFGYAFGRQVGPKIFTKKDSFFFHRDHVERARVFYEKRGGQAIILARFMPVIRTFAPILAGVGKMHYSRFLAYNVVGAFIWTFGVTLAGYFLGRAIPGIDRYIIPIALLIILVSVAPGALEYLKHRRKKTANQLK